MIYINKVKNRKKNKNEAAINKERKNERKKGEKKAAVILKLFNNAYTSYQVMLKYGFLLIALIFQTTVTF